MDERKKKGGGNTSSPVSLSYTFYTKPDKKKYIFFVQYSSCFPCQLTWLRNASIQIAMLFTLYLYTRTVYRRILKFFKQAGNSRILMLLFVKWFFLWVSQSFMSLNIRHRNCVIVLCVFFCVYWSEMLCAHCYL